MTEKQLSDNVRDRLNKLGWITIKTHGNQFQSGLPDLICTHKNYGVKFIETKAKLKFTKAQKYQFPILNNNGTNIYIITISNYEQLLDIILNKSNLGDYL